MTLQALATIRRDLVPADTVPNAGFSAVDPDRPVLVRLGKHRRTHFHLRLSTGEARQLANHLLSQVIKHEDSHQ